MTFTVFGLKDFLFCFVYYYKGGRRTERQGRRGEKGRKGRRDEGRLAGRKGKTKAIKSANTPKLKSGVLFHLSCDRKEVTRYPSN